MASDIRISELNAINVNSDLNEIIINSRETANDIGVTKKIQVSNFLTPDIVKTNNITAGAITNAKLADQVVTCDKIASKSITNDQIANNTVNNGLLANDSVDGRVVNENCDYNVKNITASNCVGALNASISDRLTVTSGRVSLNNIQYAFPATELPRRFLQTDGIGNLSWKEAVPGDGTTLVFSDIVPVGTIISWAGAALPADGKWLECNGTTFNGTAFPELSSALGDTWGTHSGVNYYLPNLKGRIPVGAGAANDGTESRTFTLGTSGGKYNHTLTVDEMPIHSHTFNTDANYGQRDATANKAANYIAGQCENTPIGPANTTINNQNYINACGGGQPHNNIQPYAVTRYIIKALPDDIQQYDMSVGPGLSALDALGLQTASVDLSSTEIGLKVTDDFQFDGSGRLKLNDNISASSITFDDGTVQTTSELTAYYGVMVSNIGNRTTPAQMRADRSTGNFYGAWDEYSKGWITTGVNNRYYPSTNSLMYTMHVNALADTTITMYNFANDDYFYIYVDDVLKYTGPNYASLQPRVVTFNLTTGIRRIDIVKNDSGSGSNSFELMGNIIGTNVRFISGY